MSKDDIKNRIAPKQNNLCALSNEKLPNDFSLMDTDRIKERFKGGTYSDDNTRIVLPTAHMERHGTLREREEWLDHLKMLMDDRNQTMKLKQKIENQLLAYKRRTDVLHSNTVNFLETMAEPVVNKLKEIDKIITKHLKQTDDQLVKTALNVPGVGAITIAGLLIYVDFEKAEHASSMWKYVGLHAASHERYVKGVTGGGNKTLRTILWNTANSMMKNRKCPYREVYDRTRQRLDVSEKMVKSRNNQGKEVTVMWKDTMASHRHGAALRAMMKHFLADYWFVGRTLAGLGTRSLYVEEYLGHTGIIKPSERGWKY